MMNLFDHHREELTRTQAPLATRMRPRTLDELYGQDAILGPGKLLRRAIEADQLHSLIFYGPPGTGKTTIARIIADTTKAYFEQLNAVAAGVADIRRVVREARERLGQYERRTVVFIDEIHRFNKSQQDALLPYVEDGTIILIGATTQSPTYELNPALISRSRLFRLEPLGNEHIRAILRNALRDKERGLGRLPLETEEAALDHLVDVANGDARTALNALELAALTTAPDPGGIIRITLPVAEESIQRRVLQYDKSGDNHYDTISAFIKSLRGSEPDAALYWLARMLDAGEDPRFIARRLFVHAAEDVGLADPQALLIAAAAAQAVEFIGLPEARIPLAEAVIYIAAAPKSNAVVAAIDAASKDVVAKKAGSVPPHLRDASYPGAERLGHGVGYKYPHDFPGAFVPQQYLPDGLGPVTYYRPTDRGREKEIRERLAKIRSDKG